MLQFLNSVTDKLDLLKFGYINDGGMNSSLPLLKFYGTTLFFRKDHINLWSVLALLS